MAGPPLEVDFDSLAVRANPFPLLRRLREEDPVHYVPSLDGWLVSRYEDVREAYVHPLLTGDRRVGNDYVQPPEGSLFRWIDDHGLMALDRKEHAGMRRLVASGFTPRGVRRMDGQIREVIARYAAPLASRTDVVDIMAEFTSPIPNAVISAITGVTAPGGVGEERFSRLAQETIQGFFGFVSEEVMARAERCCVELCAWVRATVEARREQPEDDLISDLVAARDGDARLTDEDIVGLVSALVAAGSETTATSGMVAIVTLLDFPEALARVRADRSLIRQTVNEILRYGFGRLTGTQRFATEDFEWKGRRLRKGQVVVLSMGGANRDPEKYPNPDVFDIDRNPQDLLTFGIGPHFCLGANLAKGELEGIVDAALDFLPEGAAVSRHDMRVESLGMFDRVMTCPVDFGAGRRRGRS